MSSHRDWFRSYTPLVNPIKVVLRDDSVIPTVGIGCIFVCMHTSSQWNPAILQDILHVPDLHGNLLSISHFNRRGHKICFADNGCQLLDKSKNLVCVGHLRGNLYMVDIKVAGTESARVTHIDEFPSEGTDLSDCSPTAFANTAHTDLATWHRHFSHMHTNAINHMLEKGMVTGMTLMSNSPPFHAVRTLPQGKANLQNHSENDRHLRRSSTQMDLFRCMRKDLDLLASRIRVLRHLD
jgi:hypothetical protein